MFPHSIVISCANFMLVLKISATRASELTVKLTDIRSQNPRLIGVLSVSNRVKQDGEPCQSHHNHPVIPPEARS